MGTGHVMRCLALAQAWQDAGGRAIFVMGESPALETRLQSEGFAVERSTAEPGSEEDARHTGEQARHHEAGWVVLDGYQFTGEYQRRIKGAGVRLLALDDFGHAGHYWADLVLNQNLTADEHLYRSREPGTRLLLGTRYALLRREFLAYRGWQRRTPERGRRVLVTLGGSDPDNATLKVVRALSRCKSGDDPEVVVVVGGSNPHYAVLAEAVRASPVRVELRRDPGSMAELMTWADVAVSAAGTTTWERAFLGLPGLILVLADNQAAIAAACDAAGLGRNLGLAADWAESRLAQALDDLLADGPARSAMASQGRERVDGEGGDRVCMVLRGERIRLRPARPEDTRLLWEWANDPAVRAASFSADPIPYGIHQDWFARKSGDPDCRILIAVDADDLPVGQVRFERDAVGDAIVGLNLDSSTRGRGLGTALIRKGVELVLGQSWVRRVHAYIKPQNQASLKSFAGAGFLIVGKEQFQGEPAIHAVTRVPDCPAMPPHHDGEVL